MRRKKGRGKVKGVIELGEGMNLGVAGEPDGEDNKQCSAVDLAGRRWDVIGIEFGNRDVNYVRVVQDSPGTKWEKIVCTADSGACRTV